MALWFLKRHQMKHLDFLILLLESRRSVVQKHSPLPLFLLSSIIYAAFDDADFWTIFGCASPKRRAPAK